MLFIYFLILIFLISKLIDTINLGSNFVYISGEIFIIMIIITFIFLEFQEDDKTDNDNSNS